jgi:ADP-heptose:LPS heptosyltransferase
MSNSLHALVIHLNALGDVVRGTGVPRAVKALFPDATVDFLSEESIAPMLYHSPSIDAVHSLPHKTLQARVGVGEPLIAAAYESVHNLVKRLRCAEYTFVVNLHFSIIGALLTRLITDGPYAGFGMTAGGMPSVSGQTALDFHTMFFGTQERRLESRIPLYAQYVRLLQDIGLKPDVGAARTELFVTDQETEWAKDFLRGEEVGPDDLLVGIHAGAGWTEKRWHTDKFVRLADFLAERHEAKILLTGVLVELERTIQPIVERTRAHTVVSAGRATLRQTMALMRRCRLFIAGDTGPMHVASALGVPTLALFGGGRPYECRPSGPGHAVVVADSMEALPADSVIDAADRLLRLQRDPADFDSNMIPRWESEIQKPVVFLTKEFPLNDGDNSNESG